MVRFLAILLWLYPPDFRRAFSAEMVVVIRDTCQRWPDVPPEICGLLAGAMSEWGRRTGWQVSLGSVALTFAIHTALYAYLLGI
ncbi:MAG: hypothetical protein K2X03_23250 [Bryobacteraceae bacterium]|nr:hypothetical protein [Bryobacteraceae bacterium]